MWGLKFGRKTSTWCFCSQERRIMNSQYIKAHLPHVFILSQTYWFGNLEAIDHSLVFYKEVTDVKPYTIPAFKEDFAKRLLWCKQPLQGLHLLSTPLRRDHRSNSPSAAILSSSDKLSYSWSFFFLGRRSATAAWTSSVSWDVRLVIECGPAL